MSILTPLQPIPYLQGNTPHSGQSSGVDSSTHNLLKGEVVQHLGNNRFLIDIGGKQIEMQSKTPLTVGQQLRLTVSGSAPLELRILPESTDAKGVQQTLITPQQAATQLLTHSSSFSAKTIDLGSLFSILAAVNTTQTPLSGETLTTVANFFSMQQNVLQNKADSGSILQQLINHLGLSHEKNLANHQNSTAATQLKNSLLEIFNLFGKESTVGQEASRLSGIIEFFQLANIAQPSNNELVLPLPLSFLEQGFLRIFQDETASEQETDDDKNSAQRFSLYLTMRNIGNLQVDFTGNDSGMFLHIHTESEEKQKFIEQYSDEIEDFLSTKMVLRGIRFSHDAKEPAGELLQLSLPQNRGLLNTKA